MEKKTKTKVAVDITPEPETPVLITGYFVKNCNYLRLREKPSYESDTLALIPVGSAVDPILTYSNKTFYRVKFGDFVGYCDKEYIEAVTATSDVK
jgi:hypothetical protein